MIARSAFFLFVFLSCLIFSEQTCDMPCGFHATCVEDKCKCLEGAEGDASFYCHPEGTQHCDIYGDPIVISFSGDKTRIKLACAANLARFDVAEGSSDTGSLMDGVDMTGGFDNSDCAPGWCRFIVQGDVSLSYGGQYFVDNVQIKIVINRGQPKNNNVARLRIQLGSSGARFSTRSVSESWTPWTNVTMSLCTRIQICDREFEVCRDRHRNSWRVYSTACGYTDIAYRPWDAFFENQPVTPGVVISTRGEMVTTNEGSQFPRSFCHVPPRSDDDTVYRDYKIDKGLSTRYISAIYAMLDNPSPQIKQECTDLLDTFSACDPDLQVDAVNVCGRIPIDWAMCARKRQYEAVEPFRRCIEGFCKRQQNLCNQAAKMILRMSDDDESCPSYYYGWFRC